MITIIGHIIGKPHGKIYVGTLDISFPQSVSISKVATRKKKGVNES